MTLIKREDAIEAIKKEIQDFEANYMHGEDDEEYGHDIGFVAGLHRAKTFIRSLPSAEYVRIEVYRDLYEKYIELKHKTEWIPCSDRLPSESDYYLVTNINAFEEKEVCVIWFAHKTDYGVSEWREITDEDTILAWMPLPKPYRKDGEA